MEIIEKFLSPAGRNKLATYTKKQKSVPLYVVGIHVNETELICSKPKQASGQMTTGLLGISTYRKKVAWNGNMDFVVPPSCFEFLCTTESTYQDTLSSFLKESVLDLVKKPASGAVIAAFSFPVHSPWDNSKEDLQQLVDQCFADCKWLVPTVVSILDHYPGEGQDGIVYVDKKWTTFFLDEKKYSVAFGTDTDFRVFRCNDYLNNSTREWTQKSYSSWEKGFTEICRTLSKFRKGPKQPFIGFAGEQYRDVIGKAIASGNLAADAVAWENPADITAKVLLPRTSKAPQSSGEKKTGAGSENHGTKRNRSPNQNGVKNERQMKTTEDLFKW